MHSIAPHVGGYRYRVEPKMLEYATGVECRSIRDVTPLGISYGQDAWVFLSDVLHRLVQLLPTARANSLVECQIGLVGYAQVCRSIHYRLIELEYSLPTPCYAIGQFGDIGI